MMQGKIENPAAPAEQGHPPAVQGTRGARMRMNRVWPGSLLRSTDNALASEDNLQDLIQVVRFVGKLLFSEPFCWPLLQYVYALL